MQNQRHVKVSDLLRTPGKTDHIDFSERYVDGIDGILPPGISGSIYLKSINNSCVEVFLEDIVCTIDDISDISGESFIREISIDNYDVLFCLPEQEWQKEDNLDIYTSYSDIYTIDEKDTSVDIQVCLVNAIKSQEPLIKKKDDEYLLDWWEDDEYFV